MCNPHTEESIVLFIDEKVQKGKGKRFICYLLGGRKTGNFVKEKDSIFVRFPREVMETISMSICCVSSRGLCDDSGSLSWKSAAEQSTCRSRSDTGAWAAPKNTKREDGGDTIPLRGYEQLPRDLHLSNINFLCCFLKLYFL